MEDDPTVLEIRRTEKRSRLDKPFMAPGELINIRTVVIRVTRERLREQLLSPSTGEPCSNSIIALWEKGRRPIPLWAARHLRALAAAVKQYDEKKAMNA